LFFICSSFYLRRFVTLVRSRMAKIILYTPEAKCSLMETGVDFEAVYLSGVKISIYRENFKYDDPLKIKIINNIDKSESSLDFDRVSTPNISAVEQFSPEIRQMLDNAITVCEEKFLIEEIYFFVLVLFILFIKRSNT
jgi:hypothetical protein